MAEILHNSHAGVQGPMSNAPPARHPTVSPHQPAFTPAWLPAGPDSQAQFPVDAGIRHQQAEPYVGAAEAAARALGDDLIGRERRRTPSGPAAPYQKAAAQRSAARALRPWDPVSGAGERAGAVLLKVPGSNAGAGAFAAPDAPALFVPPSSEQAAAVAAAAGRVARKGQDQRTAVGAFSARQGAPARELWPVELFKQPPKYCTACRGGHEPSKVGNPEWEPYNPAARLGNLQLIDTKFRRAMRKGLLCCKMSDSEWEPVRWSVQPSAMPPEQFRQQLALAFHGVREGHEPFRFLATRAVEGLLAAPGRGPLVAEAVPELVAPIKLCLNTMQPQLVGGLLLLLIRLLRCHPSVPAALGPYCRHLLPTFAVFRSHRRCLQLPAPVCLPPTGSFSGSGAPHGSVKRDCRVCGAPLYREFDKPGVPERLAWGAQPAGGQPSSAEAAATQRLPGRFGRRYTLESLIEEVLGLLAAVGGEVAQRVIRNYLPGFTYFAPQDQPQYPTVEEVLEARRTAEGTHRPPRHVSRPASAPRVVGPARTRPGTAPGAAAAAAATAAPAPAATAAAAGARKAGKAAAGPQGKKGAAAAARRDPRPRRHSDDGYADGGGGGGGGGRPAWSNSVVTAADLARWDGIEFRDVPRWLEAEAEAEAYEQVELGGGGGGRTAALRISTPVPVFESPHDPLYAMLAASAIDFSGATRGSVKRSQTSSRPSGARRGGSGGGAPRANVNAEVPYKASPAGLKQAW